MTIIGLTGGIATGKTTVSGIFREYGIPVIDADLVAREVVQPGTSSYLQLRQEFGPDYFDDANGGVLRREELGKLVFSNPEKRRRLNAITHPAIRMLMLRQLVWHLITGCSYIVFDTPLLFEAGYDKFISPTVVVWCDADKELIRLMARDGMSEEDARNRMSSQMPIEDKKRRATRLIDNNGSKQELRQQVERLIVELNSEWTPLLFRAAITAVVGCLSWFILRAVLSRL